MLARVAAEPGEDRPRGRGHYFFLCFLVALCVTDFFGCFVTCFGRFVTWCFVTSCTALVTWRAGLAANATVGVANAASVSSNASFLIGLLLRATRAACTARRCTAPPLPRLEALAKRSRTPAPPSRAGRKLRRRSR